MDTAKREVFPKAVNPELKKFLGKRISAKLNGNRVVTGRLAGFDPSMNLTLEEAVHEIGPGERQEIGLMVVRGSSVVQLEGLDRVG